MCTQEKKNGICLHCCGYGGGMEELHGSDERDGMSVRSSADQYIFGVREVYSVCVVYLSWPPFRIFHLISSS